MSTLEKTYQPNLVESKWYSCWMASDAFKARIDSQKESFCIMIPPPNVTGVLTLGHVLNNTLQDALVRRARQKGKAVLWLPGTDHAGLATQTKVEQLLAKEGKKKEDLGREAFIQKTKEWSEKHGGIIIEQLKRLGASCDWSRAVYTLDEGYSEAVLHAFVHLYEKGCVYRGKRMINWCPKSQTALSDEEVFTRTEKSFLYKVRYPVIERPGEYVEISTQRPETIPADVAVAVHPDDERYQHLKGCHLARPLVEGKIPLIFDAAVDPEFGTGALKITPAHALVDFEIAERHGLPFIDILNPDGTLNALAGPELAHMERFKAREASVLLLEKASLLTGKLAYETNLPYSERGNVVVEPRLSEQWFLKYPRIEEAKQVVEKGLIRFHPERWTKTYLYWLDNIKDWCISRQVWWGHRIPVWYPKGKDRRDASLWHVSVRGPKDPENWEQDEDTFDTWASSWLWPFATLGWPYDTKETEAGLSYWFPTQDLVTGPDIIFFWVARMIIASLELLGESPDRPLNMEECAARIPFQNVYFTGIIRDAQGRKMSKSLGNSPDPIDLINTYGADGLRYGILSMAPQGQDIFFQENGIAQGRNFCNKLWNAARFREMSGAPSTDLSPEGLAAAIDAQLMDTADEAILLQLIEMTRNVERYFSQYEFQQAVQTIEAFFWKHYCDGYVEMAKLRQQDPSLKAHVLSIQDFILRQLLLVLHPVAPFITEELWHSLGYAREEQDFIQNTGPLSPEGITQMLEREGISLHPSAVEEMEAVREFISISRALKAQYQLQANKGVAFSLQLMLDAKPLLERHLETLLKQIGAANIHLVDELPQGPSAVTPWGPITLHLEGMRDTSQERSRLMKELQRLEKAVQAGRSKLTSEEFLSKAPPNIIEGAKAQLNATETEYASTLKLLEALG
jgi:valyl-tRNA synthetase